MEEQNLRAILRILGGDPEGKVCRLLDFSDRPRDIADPWYTGNFDVTYDDIFEGIDVKLTLYRNTWDKAELRKVITAFAQRKGNTTIEIREEM